jgi:hypothetical protein
MKYRSADHAMRAYLRLRAATDGPPGFQLYDDVDRYVEQCARAKCRRKKLPRRKRWRVQDGKWYCKSCGALRPIERVQVLHAAGRDRAAGAEPARDRLADLGIVWRVLSENEERLLFARVVTPRYQDDDPLLAVLRQRWPWGPWRGWDARELGRQVRDVRRKVEARLVGLEMMDGGDLAA